MIVSHGSASAYSPHHLGYELYSRTWNALGVEIEKQKNRIAQRIFTQLDTFISTEHERWRSHSLNAVFPSSLELTKHSKQIPTAVVLAGVNTPDHRNMYDKLRSSVLNKQGHMAIIHSGSIITSARTLVSAVVSQLISKDHDSDASELDQDNRDSIRLLSRLGTKKELAPSVASTYLGLYHWYFSQIDQNDDPSSTNTKFPVKEADHMPTPPTHKSRRSLSQPAPRHSNPAPDCISIKAQPKSSHPRVRRFTTRAESYSSRITTTPSHPHNSIPTKVVQQPRLSLRPGPLVVVLPQVESIPTTILQEFIELSSIYVCEENKLRPNTLPLILILGLSTSPEVSFESRLSASTLARLRITQFTVPPPTMFLDSVLTELIDFPGFRLTHSIQKFLIDSVFLCLDFSVQNFVSRFKFCMLDYYLSCPHPQLLLPPDEARVYLHSMPPSDLAHCVSVLYPSMASCATEKVTRPWSPSSGPTTPTEASSSLVDHLVDRLKAHWCLAYLAPRVLRWFLALITSIPGQPMGRSVTDLYRLWLKDDLTTSSAFSVTMSLMHTLSKNVLINALEDALNGLQDFTAMHDSKSLARWPLSIMQECNGRLTELAKMTSQWCDELRASSLEPSNKTTGQVSAPPPSPLTTPSQSMFSGQRKISLRGLKQHLQEMAASSPSGLSSPRATFQTEYDRKRHAFVTWLREELGRLLPMPFSLPLYEVFYGPWTSSSGSNIQQQQHATSIRRRLNPPVQRCLHQTLIDPGSVLQIPEFTLSSPDSLSPQLPDLCILYKLHLESLKMINLYDWLMAFATVLGETTDSMKPPTKSVQARFFHGVAQLHLLGYVKSTRRKADHVQRLTWGVTV